MDITTFLKATRDLEKVHTRDTPQNPYKFLWDVFDDVIDIFSDSENLKPELIVSESNGSQTQFVRFSNHAYIVLEITQLRELATGITKLQGCDDDNILTPVLLAMLERANKRIVMKGVIEGLELETEVSIGLAFSLTDREKMVLARNEVFDALSRLPGFRYLFLPVLVFVIAHELFHSLRGYLYWDEKFQSAQDKFKIHSEKNIEFEYVDGRIKTAFRLIESSHHAEELYCDENALMVVWKICVNKIGMHPTLVCFSVSQIHNSILLFATKKSKSTKDYLKEIFSRKLFALRLLTVLYDKYVATLTEFVAIPSQYLAILFGTNEVVVEYSHHLGIASILNSVDEPLKSELFIIEDIFVEVETSDGSFLHPVDDVPTGYFQKVVSHNLQAQQLLCVSANPMLYEGLNIQDIPSLSGNLDEFRKNQVNILKRKELFLKIFWKKITSK